MSSIGVATAILLLFGAPAAGHAQAVQLVDRELPSMASVRELRGKCDLIVAWVERVRTDPGPVLNLFRDEDYVQLFGQPFDVQPPAQRVEFYDNVVSPCLGRTPPPRQGLMRRAVRLDDIRARLESFAYLFDSAFRGAGSIPISDVSAHVVKSRELRGWLAKVLAELPQFSPDLASFRRLDELRRNDRPKLVGMWESERKAFESAVSEAQSSLTERAVSEMMARAEAAPPGWVSAQALWNERNEYAGALEFLSPAELRAFNSQQSAALEKLMTPVIDAEKRALIEVPLSLAGARQLSASVRRLVQEVGPLRDLPSVGILFGMYGAKWGSLYEAALPEWQALLGKVSADATAPFRNQLSELFPDQAARARPIYKQYAGVLEGIEERARAATEAKLGAERAAADAKAAEAREEERAAEAKALLGKMAATNSDRARKGLPPITASCDDLAAHPADPGKSGAAGVRDEDVSALAVDACELAASQATAGDGRVLFQLGRAYWASERYEDAVDAFLLAEAAGYVPAYYYLGLAYEQGRIEGQAPDLATAAQMYLVAAAEEFEPAVVAYKGIDWSIDFTEFAAPRLIEALYQYEPDAPIPPLSESDRREFLLYLRGVREFLALQPNEYDASCHGIITPEIVKNYVDANNQEVATRMWTEPPPDLLGAIFQLEKTAEMTVRAVQNGTDDAYALVMDYGGCNGQTVRRIVRNMSAVTAAIAGRKP